MSKSTPPAAILAAGQITRNDRLTVELVQQHADTPAVVVIHWPQAPSVLSPSARDLAGATRLIVRILAEAQAKLAAIKAGQL